MWLHTAAVAVVVRSISDRLRLAKAEFRWARDLAEKTACPSGHNTGSKNSMSKWSAIERLWAEFASAVSWDDRGQREDKERKNTARRGNGPLDALRLANRRCTHACMWLAVTRHNIDCLSVRLTKLLSSSIVTSLQE